MSRGEGVRVPVKQAALPMLTVIGIAVGLGLRWLLRRKPEDGTARCE